jgi:hypothetical protein
VCIMHACMQALMHQLLTISTSFSCTCNAIGKYSRQLRACINYVSRKFTRCRESARVVKGTVTAIILRLSVMSQEPELHSQISGYVAGCIRIYIQAA